MVKRGGKDLVYLVQGYAESQAPTRWKYLSAIVDSPHAQENPEVAEWIENTLRRLAADAYPEAKTLLKAFRQPGRKPEPGK